MSKVTTLPKKGFKFRIYPTEEQKQYLTELFGANRFLWNHLLSKTEEAYKEYQAKCEVAPNQKHEYPKTGGYYFVTRIPAIKEEFPWMKGYSSVAYQQTALHLGDAYSRLFNRNLKNAGKPKYKSKYHEQSVTLMKTAFTLKDGVFKVGRKLGAIEVVWSRNLPYYPSSCVISLNRAGQYHVSFTCEYDPDKTSGTEVIGVDLGISDLAVLSTGEKIANPKHYVNSQAKLRRLQQKLSRCKKGSKNRNKAKHKLAKQHLRAANQRKDFLHKLSTDLVNKSQVIGIEKLNVSGMSKMRSLSKHIMDAGWGEFARQLVYKSAESQHCSIVKLDPYFPSSHVCNKTWMKLPRRLKLSERSWDCPHCGETHDRDINAAKVMAKEAFKTLKEKGWPEVEVGGIFIQGKPYTEPPRHMNIQIPAGQSVTACGEFLPPGTGNGIQAPL